jgi:hypothetical protein
MSKLGIACSSLSKLIFVANLFCPSTSFSFSQMASGTESVAGDDIERTKAILVSRRCIILALVGSTPVGNTSLDLILQNGYLSSVKLWMDDILSGSVGES